VKSQRSFSISNSGSNAIPPFIFAVPFILGCSGATAANLPTGFTETEFGGSLSGAPTAMEFSPDGRLFVCLQAGQLRVIKNGSMLATPFLSFSVNSSGERGLLGIAFDTNCFSNHYIYVYYTVSTSPIHNRVSRRTLLSRSKFWWSGFPS